MMPETKKLQWKAEDIRKVIANPIHVLLGGVPEDQFIRAAEQVVKEIGLDGYLKLLLQNLREQRGL